MQKVSELPGLEVHILKRVHSNHLGDHILTTGFTKGSERQISLWDTRSMEQSLHTVQMDTSPGFLLPFYDADTDVAFVIGKVSLFVDQSLTKKKQ